MKREIKAVLEEMSSVAHNVYALLEPDGREFVLSFPRSAGAATTVGLSVLQFSRAAQLY